MAAEALSILGIEKGCEEFSDIYYGFGIGDELWVGSKEVEHGCIDNLEIFGGIEGAERLHELRFLESYVHIKGKISIDGISEVKLLFGASFYIEAEIEGVEKLWIEGESGLIERAEMSFLEVSAKQLWLVGEIKIRSLQVNMSCDAMRIEGSLSADLMKVIAAKEVMNEGKWSVGYLQMEAQSLHNKSSMTGEEWNITLVEKLVNDGEFVVKSWKAQCSGLNNNGKMMGEERAQRSRRRRRVAAVAPAPTSAVRKRSVSERRAPWIQSRRMIKR